MLCDLSSSPDVIAGDAVVLFRAPVPNDISVAGFNDTIGSVLHPALTTAREFSKEQGRHLAEFVLRRIHEPEQAPQQVVIPTELIRRDSVRFVVGGR